MSFTNTVETPIPAWFLAPYEEKEIRRRTQERAEQKCRKQFMKFGMCMEKHQILFGYYCGDLKQEMISCVAQWGAQEKYEELRAEYIAEKKSQLAKEGKL